MMKRTFVLLMLVVLPAQGIAVVAQAFAAPCPHCVEAGGVCQMGQDACGDHCAGNAGVQFSAVFHASAPKMDASGTDIIPLKAAACLEAALNYPEPPPRCFPV